MMSVESQDRLYELCWVVVDGLVALALHGDDRRPRNARGDRRRRRAQVPRALGAQKHPHRDRDSGEPIGEPITV
jgi:hypothetical protein